MPYKSERQRRFFHTRTAREHGITPAMVKEYDEASRGKHYPERASHKFLKQRAKGRAYR